MNNVDYIKWQAGTKWHNFDLSDINHMPQRHALHLFNQDKINVVAKQGNQFIVSSPDLVAVYRRKGNRVMLFSEVLEQSTRLDQKFGYAGFQEC